MQAQLQGVELERVVDGHHDLAIQHTPLRQLLFDRVDELWEVSIERPLVATLNENFVAVAKDQRAESVPLRLEDPAFTRRQLAHTLGEHWQYRRFDGKIHDGR